MKRLPPCATASAPPARAVSIERVEVVPEA